MKAGGNYPEPVAAIGSAAQSEWPGVARPSA